MSSIFRVSVNLFFSIYHIFTALFRGYDWGCPNNVSFYHHVEWQSSCAMLYPSVFYHFCFCFFLYWIQKRKTSCNLKIIKKVHCITSMPTHASDFKAGWGAACFWPKQQPASDQIICLKFQKNPTWVRIRNPRFSSSPFHHYLINLINLMENQQMEEKEKSLDWSMTC